MDISQIHLNQSALGLSQVSDTPLIVGLEEVDRKLLCMASYEWLWPTYGPQFRTVSLSEHFFKTSDAVHENAISYGLKLL